MNYNNENIPEYVKKVIEHLYKNKMAGYYVKDKSSLISLLEDLIKDGETVGCGDSFYWVIQNGRPDKKEELCSYDIRLRSSSVITYSFLYA